MLLGILIYDSLLGISILSLYNELLVKFLINRFLFVNTFDGQKSYKSLK
jgi:hypothetical protein